MADTKFGYERMVVLSMFKNIGGFETEMLLLPHLDYLSYTRACARAHAHTHTHTRADAKKYLLKKATVWPRRDLLNKIRRIHTGFFPPVRP